MIFDALHLLGIVCILILGLSICYSVLQFALVLTFKRRHPAKATIESNSSVVILRPLRKASESTYEALKSLYHQTRTPTEIRYGVDFKEDSSVRVVERLKKEYPRVPSLLKIAANGEAENRKIGKLEALASGVTAPFLVAIDQDIRMSSEHLEQILSMFSDSRIGLVTSLYRIKKPQTIASAMELLAVHADFFPSVLVSEVLEGGICYAFGATLAIRSAILEKIGGFESVKNYLADDHELGVRVCRQGYTVALSGSLVEHDPGRLNFRDYWNRSIRAARTSRVCRPRGYGLSLLTHGLPWVLGSVAILGWSPITESVFGLWVFARLFAVISADFFLTNGEGPWWPLLLLPFHEMARFLFWVLAFTGDRVRWGDDVYEVSRDGQMRRER